MASIGTPLPPGTRISVPADSSFWSRVSTWVSEHKAAVYTIVGVTVVVTGAGAVYYINSTPGPKSSQLRPSKKERRKQKKQADEAGKAAASASAGSSATTSKAAPVGSADELPEINEQTVASFSDAERKRYAGKLKELGNKSYGAKDWERAIHLYTLAILCKPEAVYYSNRAACYNADGKWDKVVEDTTAALNLEPQYVKALNRRGSAYENLGKYSEALLDYTASCIIESFSNQISSNAVERLLKKFAESKAKEILETRKPKLPSPSFVSNYLQSFRSKPRPAGLEDTVELSPETGKGQLQLGLKGMEKKTGDGYEEAATAFEKALELGDLGEYEALAYNLRGTFRCLKGKAEESMADLTKSIELDPNMTQSYIKRASMNLEFLQAEMAMNDFVEAIQHDANDPDIYYHRAQLHFINNEYAEAAKDYQRSIDLDKDFIFSHIQLGVTQYKMGSIASSMATFRRCMKNFENTPDVYNYYGELLLDQQKHQEAIEKFDKAMEMEKQMKPMGMNVLPLINKALALFQWKQDFVEAENLCRKALIIDEECDIAVATMAQLLLQQGKVTEALQYFERAAELARTENELVNALSYAEATRTQLQVQQKYPELSAKLSGMNPSMMR
ncbi:hypothetical protein P8C59_008511 [Phyllachora maydis]|uniref:Uncharacterized protein n=1 Tax=Phyllachora maydis TaxID=1825666 RepID=A0AAD9MEN6_9PEZI|nr:hypothetical protein P8C59_008511 [Phyllachora maydis]